MKQASRFVVVSSFIAVLTFMATSPATTRAEEFWSLPQGQVALDFDSVALDRLGVVIPSARAQQQDAKDRLHLTLPLDKYDGFSFVSENRRVTKLLQDTVSLGEGIHMVGPGGEAIVFDLIVAREDRSLQTRATPTTDVIDRDIALIIRGIKVGFAESSQEFTLPAQELTLSEGLARALGDRRLAGSSIGHVIVRGQARWIAGDGITANRAESPSAPEGFEASSAAPQGPDITFCELYDLSQKGRVGSVVGLAVATTSWNTGTEDAMWFQIPNEHHPVIAQNLFRLKDDRFEQIGQSWVKHGFYALDSEQCGTDCTFESGHSSGAWLGVGCTDTYSSFLNGSQSSLGPRHEINPWTGAWEYTGSHMDPNSSPPPHDNISHRLQVHDDDLNQILNDQAQYFAEGYYVASDDVFHENNASWKPVTIQSGSPGGVWGFGMSGATSSPTIGFAIDAWPGAQKTILAQETPVTVGVSPDGRCILAAKATDQGGGLWNYEYALYNMDMDRKVSSFSVPIVDGTAISNIGFHAVLHHDEPYSNDLWTASVATDAVVWSTTDNPLRWGTMYNFRFTANVPPFDTTVTLGLYEPGTPDTVTGMTTGPDPRDPNCQVALPAVVVDPQIARNRYLVIEGGNPGEPTAVRVRLTSLLQGQVASQIASEFDGEVRWLGPPTEFDANPGMSPPTFMASQLQCEPYYTDWSAVGPVYVYDAAIMPNSSYDVQVLHQNCDLFSDDEAKYSTPASADTALWGDVVSPYGTWDNPGGQPNFGDITAIVDTFADRGGAVHKTRAQLQPNVPQPAGSVSFADITADVDAFKGTGYPFVGPTSCP